MGAYGGVWGRIGAHGGVWGVWGRMGAYRAYGGVWGRMGRMGAYSIQSEATRERGLTKRGPLTIYTNINDIAYILYYITIYQYGRDKRRV